jgi:2'-5' RNA ligase
MMIEEGMSEDSPGLASGFAGSDGAINSFALVTYVPPPMGTLLDQIRRLLEPDAVAPRAHVTVLPPRPLEAGVNIGDACRCLGRSLPGLTPITIIGCSVKVFDLTNVVYLSLARESHQALEEMHRLLHRDEVAGVERFPYHPHITLAQNLTAEQAIQARDQAAAVWRQYAGPRRFLAENFTLVQNTNINRWVDLAEFSLSPLAIAGR